MENGSASQTREWDFPVNTLVLVWGRTESFPRNSELLCLASFYSLIAYTEQYVEYDPFIMPAEPSNPWISDDITLWDIEMR